MDIGMQIAVGLASPAVLLAVLAVLDRWAAGNVRAVQVRAGQARAQGPARLQ